MRRLICLLMLGCLLPVNALAHTNVTLAIQPLYQADYTTTLFSYEGEEKSVSTSGCGATCVSMAMAFLNAKVEQTPETLLMWAYENDRYHGAGLSCKALVEMLQAYGFTGEWIGKEPKELRQALKKGHPAIACMGPGTFTTSGHYILIYGIDPDDQLKVIDPNSKKKSKRAYPLQTIFDEISGSQAFLICQWDGEGNGQR